MGIQNHLKGKLIKANNVITFLIMTNFLPAVYTRQNAFRVFLGSSDSFTFLVSLINLY